MLRRRDCPGKASTCTLSAHNGEDTVVGPRGILDLDLNHDLDRSGPALTGKVNPSQLGWSFIPQDAGDKWVMSLECPEIARGAVVEILGRATGGISPGTQSGWNIDAGTAAGVLAAKEWVSGGVSALNHRPISGKPPASSNHRDRRGKITPEYPKSGWDVCVQDVDCEGIIRVGKVICSRVLRTEEDAAARRCHEEKWAEAQAADLGVSGKRTGLCRLFRAAISLCGVPGVARCATPGYSKGILSGCTQTKVPESGCDFVSQDIGGELVMTGECPEFGAGSGGGGRGVKAPEGWRSPRPGGITACLQDNGHLGRLRRGEDGVNAVLVGMRIRPESGCDFSSEEVVNEWVMRRGCPELGGDGGGRGGGFKAVPMNRDRSPRPGGITACLQDTWLE